MLFSLLSPEEQAHLKIWVLAPSLVTHDANIDYYYDFSQSIAEYTRIFSEMQLNWQWQPVTIDDYGFIIHHIQKEKESGTCFPVVLNLCDGDEVNGTPGISVVQLLESSGLIYTGANEYFYAVTTSKIPMKQAFNDAGVATAAWKAIHSIEETNVRLFQQLGSPLIVKPAVSGGSMGVGVRNVVSDITALKQQVSHMFKGYRGWNLASDGLIAEQFIQGPEFTCLIVGSWYEPEKCVVYNGVERVFHASLPEQEKFLSFDRLWEIYEEETPMPANENFYEYREAPATLQSKLKELSLAAFLAVKGTGYTRVDLRQDQATGKLYVLEVNAQCGLSEDENYTSIGAILRVNKTGFSALIASILAEAINRYRLKKIKERKQSTAHANY